LYFLIPLSVIYCFSFFLIYKLAPVDSPKKPIVKKEKIKLLRRKSFMTLLTYFLISVILVLLSKYDIKLINVSISLAFATLWQVFTLTKSGNKFIDTIDYKFRLNH